MARSMSFRERFQTNAPLVVAPFSECGQTLFNMMNISFFFGPVVMFSIVLVSLVGGSIAGKTGIDRAVKALFGSVALFFLWGLVFLVCYVTMGLASDVLPILSMSTSVAIARGLAATGILVFYIRWVVEQYRAPLIKGGYVAGRLHFRRRYR